MLLKGEAKNVVLKFLIAGAIKPTDSIFRIEKDIADEHSETELDCD